MIARPCTKCGDVIASGSYCLTCRPPKRVRPQRSFRERGYDAAWDRLSRRARRLQPFCLDCGTDQNLTTDHSPEAWDRQRRGLPIRLQDVAVVCMACNVRRGAARGEHSRDSREPVANPVAAQRDPRGVTPRGGRGCPGGKPQSRLNAAEYGPDQGFSGPTRGGYAL